MGHHTFRHRACEPEQLPRVLTELWEKVHEQNGVIGLCDRVVSVAMSEGELLASWMGS